MPQGPNERETRARRIDPQLARAGWGAGDRRLLSEYLLLGNASGSGDDFMNPVPRVADCAARELLKRLGRPVAVIEAKCASRYSLVAQHHAADHGDALRVQYGTDPFVFLAHEAVGIPWEGLRPGTAVGVGGGPHFGFFGGALSRSKSGETGEWTRSS